MNTISTNGYLSTYGFVVFNWNAHDTDFEENHA